MFKNSESQESWRCSKNLCWNEKHFYKDTLTVIILQQDSQDLTAVQLVSIKRHLRLRGKRPNSNKLEPCWETRFFRRWEGTLEHNVCFSLLVMTFLFPAFSQVGLLKVIPSQVKARKWAGRKTEIILFKDYFTGYFFLVYVTAFSNTKNWFVSYNKFSFGVKMKSSDSSKMSKLKYNI